MRADHLRICVDGRLLTGQSGGVEQVIIGLASGFSKLNDGDEEFLFLVYANQSSWLSPYIGGPCRLLPVPYKTLRKVQRLASSFPLAPFIFTALAKLRLNFMKELPASDGTIESAHVDIMHFTFQSAFKTNVPSLYHPWDLQHVHLPSFFAEHERNMRDLKFRTYCDRALAVSVSSSWMKEELIKHLGLPRSKVKVIPMAPSVDAYPTPVKSDLSRVRQKFELPESFLFYPAKTWPHKNHLALFEALSILRVEHGLTPPLFCSGGKTNNFPEIRDRMKRLDLASQVRFIGFVTPLELVSLYRLSRCMIFPSQYEGWGLPITEAMRLGVPVACSTVPVLMEQAGGAALFFDPVDPQAIAEIIRRLWKDEKLRQDLSQKGLAQASRFTWERTSRIFRAHYRMLAGGPMSEEDTRMVREASA